MADNSNIFLQQILGLLNKQNQVATSSVQLQHKPESPKIEESKWYIKKPMLKFLLILLTQPEKYQQYIHWVNPIPKELNEYYLQNDIESNDGFNDFLSKTSKENNLLKILENYKNHPQFGMFTIKDKLSLAVLWATIREKKIVSSVKDGFLRNLRLYYEKKNRSRCDRKIPIEDTNHQSIIRPVKRILNLSNGQQEKAIDTWQFIDKETLVSYFQNKKLVLEFKSKIYPDIDNLKINNEKFILNNLESVVTGGKGGKKRRAQIQQSKKINKEQNQTNLTYENSPPPIKISKSFNISPILNEKNNILTQYVCITQQNNQVLPQNLSPQTNFKTEEELICKSSPDEIEKNNISMRLKNNLNSIIRPNQNSTPTPTNERIRHFAGDDQEKEEETKPIFYNQLVNPLNINIKEETITEENPEKTSSSSSSCESELLEITPENRRIFLPKNMHKFLCFVPNDDVIKNKSENDMAKTLIEFLKK